jgi:two-component sensor histidine kinase/predicted hydrocarbon binding protein
LKNTIKKLEEEIKELKRENKALREKFFVPEADHTVKVPDNIAPVFNRAEKIVANYFKGLKFNPSQGTIEINKERYVLMRASALSYEFLNSIKNLYKDRGEEEAMNIGKNILFDVAHVLGLEDAKNFHKKLKLKDPISKLSAGPVHFAYTGWAFVDILPESRPTPDDNYYIKYHHPFSFEADSWLKTNKKSDTTVCIMNSGYSSGWCEASFGIPLTSVEISCRARGDKQCTFIMAPPHMIDKYLPEQKRAKHTITVPTFLERKTIEEKLKASLNEKEFLIKEIHHRVKNNLQIISSLLNLQESTIKDKEAREKYRESIGRVRSMALIHEMLYQSRNLSNIKADEYLNQLVSYIGNTYNVGKKIDVKLSIESGLKRIDMNRAVPCGLLINELLSNAFKYAFLNRKKGSILIDFKFLKKHKHKFQLSVKDNGVGMPSKVSINSPETLGLQLVQTLVEQLEGDLKVNHKKGTEFLIQFS